jgi:hypothetical protein
MGWWLADVIAARELPYRVIAHERLGTLGAVAA